MPSSRLTVSLEAYESLRAVNQKLEAHLDTLMKHNEVLFQQNVSFYQQLNHVQKERDTIVREMDAIAKVWDAEKKSLLREKDELEIKVLSMLGRSEECVMGPVQAVPQREEDRKEDSEEDRNEDIEEDKREDCEEDKDEFIEEDRDKDKEEDSEEDIEEDKKEDYEEDKEEFIEEDKEEDSEEDIEEDKKEDCEEDIEEDSEDSEEDTEQDEREPAVGERFVTVRNLRLRPQQDVGSVIYDFFEDDCVKFEDEEERPRHAGGKKRKFIKFFSSCWKKCKKLFSNSSRTKGNPEEVDDGPRHYTYVCDDDFGFVFPAGVQWCDE